MKTMDNVAVSVAFKEPGGSIDYRHSVQPGYNVDIGVSAEAYNAEGQLISGDLENPVPLAFVGTAVTVSPSTMMKGTQRLTIGGTAANTANPAAWGETESRGGSNPVPYDILTTGFGNCTAAVPEDGADTRACFTVAPLIVSTAGALGPNLSAPLTVAGQTGSTTMTVQAGGEDLSLSFFEARTGSNDDPEVADTFFTFLPLMPDKGACQGPAAGFPTAAGAWQKWVVHAYFYASPAIFYWNYGDANCVDASGAQVYQPSGLSDVLDIGPVSGGRLPYGFNVHGDAANGKRTAKGEIEITDGHEKAKFFVVVTPS